VAYFLLGHPVYALILCQLSSRAWFYLM